VDKIISHTRDGRYRKVGGKRLIEVRVKTLQQFFDARDPAPFRSRDLDDDFAEYLLASADEFTDRVQLKIKLYIEEAASTEGDRESIFEAIHGFLNYQIELKQIQLRKVFRTARLFAGIGILVLILALTLSRIVDQYLANLEVKDIIKEGLIIFGWVSLWKPLELGLFDWYPMYDRIRLLRRLDACEIDVEFGSKGANNN
jgi:hypothetical protein